MPQNKEYNEQTKQKNQTCKSDTSIVIPWAKRQVVNRGTKHPQVDQLQLQSWKRMAHSTEMSEKEVRFPTSNIQSKSKRKIQGQSQSCKTAAS